MKKVFTLLLLALLSAGPLMAQTTKQTTRLQANSLDKQIALNGMHQSMAKDVLCNWYDNIGTDLADGYIGGFATNYGIYSFAEKITNTQVLTVDSVYFMLYDNNTHGGNVTVAIYDEASSGGPGTSLSSVTVASSNWTSDSVIAVPLTTTASVTGNYYVVLTVVDDNTNLLITTNRTATTSTGYVNYSNTWFPVSSVFSSTSGALYCSFFLGAHACTADLSGSYTITANANNSAWGTVSGGGTYNAGSTCTLTATPAEGYRFLYWQDSLTTNPRSFAVLADAVYTAIFAAEPTCSYTLPYSCSFETEDEVYCWTSVDGDGDSYEWTWGESASLGHTGTHYMFSGSYLNTTGPLSPSNWLISPELNIPAGGATLTYWIAPQDQNYPDDYYELVLSPTGSTDTASFTTTLLTETLSANDFGYTQRTVQITNEGIIRFAFHHMDSYDVYIINLDDISVVANNPTESYTITVNVDNPDHGTATGSGTYYAGTQVTLTATANPGYTFLQWSDGNSQNPRTITVTGDATYTATFATNDEQEYTITLMAAWISSDGIDTIFFIEEEADFSGAGTFTEGTTTTLNVTPHDYQFYFIAWQDGNTQMPRTVTVTEDKVYIAYFAEEVSINDVDDEAQVLRTEYYDLLGRQLSAEPAHGLYLIRTITTQGQRTQKVYRH